LGTSHAFIYWPEQYQCLSVGEKMQARLKPMLQVVQSRLGGIDFRIGFRNKKKRPPLLAFTIVRNSIICQFIL
jgi:hypothetical protein